MSALNEVLDIDSRMFPAATKDARAELAQLRADLQAARDERDEAKAWHISLNAMIDRKNATIAEQARQLDEARKVIERCSAYIGSIDHGENTKSYRMCDAWLAANPAPEPQP